LVHSHANVPRIACIFPFTNVRAQCGVLRARIRSRDRSVGERRPEAGPFTSPPVGTVDRPQNLNGRMVVDFFPRIVQQQKGDVWPMKSLSTLAWSFTLFLFLVEPTHSQVFKEPGKQVSSASLRAKIDCFAPTEVTANVSRLPEAEQKALAKIVDAARLMDPLFLRQVWSGNVEMAKTLEKDGSPIGRERLHAFRINVGPWSRLDDNEPFLAGAPAKKPKSAAFYPEDMTKDEFEKWVVSLPDSEKEKARGFFHVIRRDPQGKLILVPYSKEYREFLEPAAKLLKEAALLTANPTLKNYLTKRADAFSSDDYYASDVAWMELDASIDPTVGPYETYEDELFGYKTAFEAFVTLKDEAESSKLARFSGHLQDLENNLPIEARYRNPKLGSIAPIRVVDVVFTAGDGNRGVQTAAFNLPNDERVTREKGSKRVMLKNVQEAKFKKILVPIVERVLAKDLRPDISFDAFFTHILAHELIHGLGPHDLKVGERSTNVRQQLKDLYSPFEEAKADITGLWALQHLIDKGVLDRKLEKEMYVTFLASSFRSVRFGINEAHGKGVALIFNILTDDGAFKVDQATGLFRVDATRVKEAVARLTGRLLTVEAEGSYDKAKDLLARYGVLRPEMKKALDRLGDVPVDIEPRFTAADAISRPLVLR